MERTSTCLVARCPALAEPGCFDKDRVRAQLMAGRLDDLGDRSSPVRSVVIPGVTVKGGL